MKFSRSLQGSRRSLHGCARSRSGSVDPKTQSGCNRSVFVRSLQGSGKSCRKLRVSRVRSRETHKGAHDVLTRIAHIPHRSSQIPVYSRSICIACLRVSTCTGRKARRMSVFLCAIRNLIWANGRSSSRSATCFGFVCVDRFVSWCFCALSVGFWATSEPWLKTHWRDGRRSKKQQRQLPIRL